MTSHQSPITSHPSLTVVLTHWRRPRQMGVLLAALERQSLAHVRWVWDNAGTFAETFPQRRVERIAGAGENRGCGPRWLLAAEARTEWVAIVDDDLTPADDQVLEGAVAAAERLRPAATGLAGVVLTAERTYRQGRHVRARRGKDIEVDIVKGRFVLVATARLAAVAAAADRMAAEFSTDDIAASALLGGGVLPRELAGRWRNQPTGAESLCRRPEHMRLREAARRKWKL